MMYSERQPSRPSFMLALETVVDETRLRFRPSGAGAWTTIEKREIKSAEPVRLGTWMWPCGMRVLFNGEHQYFSTSGRGVRIHLNDGTSLVLGSRQPRRLLEALLSSDAGGA